MKTNRPYGRFFALLKQLPNATKEGIIYPYENSGHLSKLAKRPDEYNKMIDAMQRMIDMQHEAELKKYRAQILKKMQEYGKDTTKWTAVNAFLAEPRIGITKANGSCKMLYEMTKEEMIGLIAKLGSILSKDKKKMEREQYLAHWN
jgi:hypothetical protein